jgi:esterase/lipase superfamily enzyme
MAPPPPVTSQPPATSTSVTDVSEEYAVVRVFYGTDRRPTGSDRADKFYGGQRSPLDAYAAGVCDVSIPNTHQPGQLEAPSILRLEFRADPARHVILRSVTQLGREDFYSQLRERFKQAGDKHALVFVHGFNVTFEDAARRTAQIAYDLKFNGVPLMYSWPSRGSLIRYKEDEDSVKWAAPHLKQFLEDVAGELGPDASIHLIAHSMGNRALTTALLGIAADARPSPRFKQVILAAPDIHADDFLNVIAPAIQKTAEQVTLYASSHDKALIVGRSLDGWPRAGESGDYLLTVPGIVTVDASGIDTSLIGHSYYALKSVLDDIDAIMRHGHGPAERKLHALTRGSATYWGLVAAATTAAAAAAVAPSPPAAGGDAWVIPNPALLLLVALVLAAVLFFVWRLIRRRRGAGSIHS